MLDTGVSEGDATGTAVCANDTFAKENSRRMVEPHFRQAEIALTPVFPKVFTTMSLGKTNFFCKHFTFAALDETRRFCGREATVPP